MSSENVTATVKETVETKEAVDIGEDVAAKDAASEFKNCIQETLSIVRNVSLKKKVGQKGEADKEQTDTK